MSVIKHDLTHEDIDNFVEEQRRYFEEGINSLIATYKEIPEFVFEVMPEGKEYITHSSHCSIVLSQTFLELRFSYLPATTQIMRVSEAHDEGIIDGSKFIEDCTNKAVELTSAYKELAYSDVKIDDPVAFSITDTNDPEICVTMGSTPALNEEEHIRQLKYLFAYGLMYTEIFADILEARLNKRLGIDLNRSPLKN